MYYMLLCNAPSGNSPALVTYLPDRPGRAWMLGYRFDPAITEPVKATAKFRKRSVLTELIHVPVPLMTRRLYEVIYNAGVSNIDVYPAIITDEDSGKVYKEYVAFNIIGAVSAADLDASQFSAPDGPLVTVDFDSLSIDESKSRGALMFRLAECVSGIVIHESVKKFIEAAGIDTLTFSPPEEWIG